MRRKLLIVLAVIISGVCLLISLYHLAYVQKIYPFIKIGEVDVSNLNLERAETKIRQAVAAGGSENILLVFGNQNWEVELNDLEINYDPLSSAQKAYLNGRSNGWFGDLKLKWRQWRRPESLPLVFNLNESRLEEVMTTAVIGIVEEPINPALILNRRGEIELVPGKNGRTVDREELNRRFKDRLGRLDFSPLEIPIRLVTIDVSAEQLVAAQTLAESLKDKRLVLNYQDFSQTIAGQELLDLISFSGGFDEKKVSGLADQLAKKLDRPSQNATFQFDGTKVVEFKPALPGLTLNQPVNTALILTSLKTMSEAKVEETVDLVVDSSAPDTSLAEVNEWGIKELLGRGESTFKGSIPDRKHNIALAAGRINGLLVAPGETFSFNQMVGDISQATGYQPAYIIQSGRTVLGDGGGVCQVSTTLFRAVLSAGLEILERHPHSYRVGYYEQNSPAGLDATVFAPSVDFKFKNDTQKHLLIQAVVDPNRNYLKFEIYGASDGRRASITNPRLWAQTPPPPDLFIDDPALPAGQLKQIDWKASGGKAAFGWTVERNGEVLYQKTFYSSYQPWQAVYLRGTAGI